jgi:hypothetical protein
MAAALEIAERSPTAPQVSRAVRLRRVIRAEKNLGKPLSRINKPQPLDQNMVNAPLNAHLHDGAGSNFAAKS